MICACGRCWRPSAPFLRAPCCHVNSVRGSRTTMWVGKKAGAGYMARLGLSFMAASEFLNDILVVQNTAALCKCEIASPFPISEMPIGSLARQTNDLAKFFLSYPDPRSGGIGGALEFSKTE